MCLLLRIWSWAEHLSIANWRAECTHVTSETHRSNCCGDSVGSPALGRPSCQQSESRHLRHLVKMTCMPQGWRIPPLSIRREHSTAAMLQAGKECAVLDHACQHAGPLKLLFLPGILWLMPAARLNACAGSNEGLQAPEEAAAVQSVVPDAADNAVVALEGRSVVGSMGSP